MGKKINAIGAGALVAGLLAVTPTVLAQNGIRFEDYRGNADVPANSRTPNFDNLSRQVNGVGKIPRLMALQGVANAVVDSGTRDSIEWLGNNPELCDMGDIGKDSASSRAACAKWKMGRIAYTVVRFPVAGNVQLRVAHDDDLKVDFSNDIDIGANYRNANWSFEVGRLSTYVGQNNWVALGTYNSPAIGSCALMRLAWVNNGGLNHLRLRYRTSNFNGGTNNATGNLEFSAADFIDPTNVAAIQSRCTGAVAAPQVSLAKQIVDGRINATDQFTLNVRRGSNMLVTGATSGTELSHALTAANLSTGSERIFIEELPLAGAVLADYSPAASCSKTTTTNQTPANVVLTTESSGASGYSWSMAAPAAGDKIACTITNTPARANLTLSKTSSVAQPDTLRTGDALTYMLQATNPGPNHANGAVLRDPAVAGVSCTAAACTSSGGAVCPQASAVTVAALQGNGITIPTFPVNGSISLTLTCAVTASGY